MKSIVIEGRVLPALAGVVVKLIVSSEMMKKLVARCFRGKAVARAGNSSRWDTPQEMIEDPLFIERFFEILAEAIRENWPQMRDGVRETIAVQFPDDVDVGWVEAVDRSQINGARLHLGKIGGGQGMVVALNDLEHPAPRTNLMRLEVDFKVDFKNTSELAVRIMDVGFGQDLHPSTGEETRQAVFFSQDHAGGEILLPLDP
jgi:hypothetical protein